MISLWEITIISKKIQFSITFISHDQITIKLRGRRPFAPTSRRCGRSSRTWRRGEFELGFPLGKCCWKIQLVDWINKKTWEKWWVHDPNYYPNYYPFIFMFFHGWLDKTWDKSWDKIIPYPMILSHINGWLQWEMNVHGIIWDKQWKLFMGCWWDNMVGFKAEDVLIGMICSWCSCLFASFFWFFDWV